jgi:hypothetical protein
MNIAASGVTLDLLDNIGQLELQWQRPLRYVKNLDEGAPYITYGSSQGSITLQGIATTAITAVGETSRAIFDGTNPNPTAAVAITVTLKKNKADSGNATVYSAYQTGKGFTFRQIAERYWVLDGITTFQFID